MPGFVGVGLAAVGIAGLAHNGGPTQTHELLPTSPALDRQAPTSQATDQRGVARPQGAAADAGSLGGISGGLAAGAPSQTDVLSWWETVQNIDLGTGKPREDLGAVLGEVGDTSRLAPKISEFESFDIGSFLADSVRESGGVDADAYAYAKQAQEFFSLLGAR